MKKRSSFQIFLDVQKALFFRELGMRFSSGRMGIFWTFFEPFFQILFFVMIKVFIFGRSSNEFDFTAFIALNFIAFNMFKNIVMKSSGAFKANKNLFVYKQVRPIDTIVARTLVEVFITSIIIIIFFSIALYFGYDTNIKDLTMVTLGFITLLIFAFAFALFVANLIFLEEGIKKVISFLMTALMFTSAIFYTVGMLPVQLQNIILYNPVVHFIELIHGSYFLGLDDRFVSYEYMLLWTMFLLYSGLWIYEKLEKRIISS